MACPISIANAVNNNEKKEPRLWERDANRAAFRDDQQKTGVDSRRA
jgi:hypothetical protein